MTRYLHAFARSKILSMIFVFEDVLRRRQRPLRSTSAPSFGGQFPRLCAISSELLPAGVR